MGFRRAIVPEGCAGSGAERGALEVREAADIRAAMAAAFGGLRSADVVRLPP